MSYSNFDLGYVVTRPDNSYARLDAYNQDSIFGPPEPPMTPSMQYITLPQEHVNYGYNALTHNSDGGNYYTVANGYGKPCTTFNTAKCPTNQIIAPAGAPAPAPAPGPAPMEGYSRGITKMSLDQKESYKLSRGVKEPFWNKANIWDKNSWKF